MWSAKLRNSLGVMALGVGLLSAATAQIETGDALPDWSQYALDGEVPDLAGKVVLVDIWASWCAPCKASFPAYAALQAEWEARGFVILGVSVDRKSKDYDRFLKQTPPGFVTVRDTDQKLVATLTPPAMPTSYIFGRDGKLRSVHQGYRGQSTLNTLRAEIEPLLAEASP